jgi:hypothetical protein
MQLLFAVLTIQPKEDSVPSILKGSRLHAAATLLLCASVAACGRASSQIGSTTNSRISASESQLTPLAVKQILIQDSFGAPIPAARVMIGTRENVPFPGNTLVADGQGLVVAPAQWTDAQPITIAANGYVRATYFARSPGALKFVLRKLINAGRYELKGKTTGFSDLSKDGMADVGLVLPAFQRAQLSLLRLSGVISPDMDTLDILGTSVDIPSNISIPKQREDYIFPATLDKPQYRLYFDELVTWPIVAAHARFSFEDVVDSLHNGQAFIDVLNKISFTGASVKEVALKGSSTGFDLPVNEVQFQPLLKVQAPAFGPDFAMLAMPMVEQNGYYYPSDIKKFVSGERLDLSTPKMPFNGLLVSIIRSAEAPDVGADSEQLSAAVVPMAQNPTIAFLPVPKNPQFRSGTLVLNPPASVVPGIAPSLTYAILNKVEAIQKGSLQLEKKHPEWELYAEAWVKEFNLPQLPASFEDSSVSKKAEKHRWEVIFGGQAAASGQLEPGPAAFEKVSHVSRSAVDL